MSLDQSYSNQLWRRADAMRKSVITDCITGTTPEELYLRELNKAIVFLANAV